MKCFLGLDTSCYTTSLALADENERILLNIQKPLEVEKGSKGLRQSDGVFQHIKNLPDIFSQIRPYGQDIAAVTASECPRPAEGSYMPAFLAGAGFAKAAAHALDARYTASTHQHGHIYAAMLGNDIPEGDFLAMHVSGGTLELLRSSQKGGIVGGIRLLGGTEDVTAGQLIDRAGVKMGLKFPCGREMEQLAKEAGEDRLKLPVTVRGTSAHLSGAETQCYRLLESGAEHRAVSRAVFRCVGETLLALAKNAFKAEKTACIMFMGGVCSSEIIKNYIVDALKKENRMAVFAKEGYAGDNACGLAVQAKRIYYAEG
jgi:N6-L-threonylcarbamoyladenine synthase